jgi:hypothetical protein
MLRPPNDLGAVFATQRVIISGFRSPTDSTGVLKSDLRAGSIGPKDLSGRFREKRREVPACHAPYGGQASLRSE